MKFRVERTNSEVFVFEVERDNIEQALVAVQVGNVSHVLSKEGVKLVSAREYDVVNQIQQTE